MRSAESIHDPPAFVAMRDQRADADDRVIDVFRELIAYRFPHFIVRGGAHAVCRGVAAQIGHCLKIPDDDVVAHRRELCTDDLRLRSAPQPPSPADNPRIYWRVAFTSEPARAAAYNLRKAHRLRNDTRPCRRALRNRDWLLLASPRRRLMLGRASTRLGAARQTLFGILVTNQRAAHLWHGEYRELHPFSRAACRSVSAYGYQDRRTRLCSQRT